METKKQYVARMKRYYEKRERKDCKIIDEDICARCGGRCCNNSPCSLMPCDVKNISVKKVKEMLDTGYYSLRTVEIIKDDKAYYVVGMSTRKQGDGRVENTWLMSPCRLLGEKGCTLSEEERPTIAILTIPGFPDSCECIVSHSEYTAAWREYSQIMNKVLKDETGRTPEQQYAITAVQTLQILVDKKRRGAALSSFETEIFESAFMTVRRLGAKYSK